MSPRPLSRPDEVTLWVESVIGPPEPTSSQTDFRRWLIDGVLVLAIVDALLMFALLGVSLWGACV